MLRVNESFSAGWTNTLKHTHTYTDPVTHTPCTHMLNQRLMFCQGFRLYPPSAKNKCRKDVEEKSPLKTSLQVQMMIKEREMKCSSKGQETLPFVLHVHTKVKWESLRTFAVDWIIDSTVQTFRLRQAHQDGRLAAQHKKMHRVDRGDAGKVCVIPLMCVHIMIHLALLTGLHKS